MYALIIIAILNGSGKAVAVHDVKFTTFDECQTAKQEITLLSRVSYDDALIRAVCVKTE